METQYETGLIRSENFLEINPPFNGINEHIKKYTYRSTESNKQVNNICEIKCNLRSLFIFKTFCLYEKGSA